MGISHIDELPMLFNFRRFNYTEEDLKMSGKLLKLWIDFSVNGQSNESWESVDNFENPKFAVINLDPIKMTNDYEDFYERMEFTRRLFKYIDGYRNYDTQGTTKTRPVRPFNFIIS